ncbi:hypothetical protein Y710_17990 [Gordonia sp. QH-12]|uniref:Gp37-like protein n=1 Tax=unclassified Gordonia (in: high G+C Gram-positive bacteria) TaxID=2657482 RepID=UPI000780DE54|nr:hypothetical protein [Gordonia sp. QH-12]KXT55656.1 hypothetical protein Y710_17990 [Gordonia sp. QH-12]
MPATAQEMRAQLMTDYQDWMTTARSRPIVEIYDKNWESSIPILSETQASFLRKHNDTGEGTLVIFGSAAARQYIVDELGEWEDLHVRVRTGYWEWTGKASSIEHEEDAEGFEYISIKFLHEFEHVKKIIAYCNPFFPAELQWPKIWAYAGPSQFGITAMIFLNLLRRFALPWTMSDNLFDPASWVANFNPANWPIVVVPKPVFTDTSGWTVLATRFGNVYDVVAPTLKDAGLRLRVYRWFPGMAQPAPNHYTLTKSTLVIDVEDVSGYVGPTGTLLDGALRLVSEVADDMINEVVNEWTYEESPEYSVGGWLGTTRENPWVTFRAPSSTYGISGVTSWKSKVNKATASTIITGGHSPDWINAGIKLLMNAALGYLGALFGNPGLALGIFDKQVEDVVLAFHRVHNPVRAEKMGEWGPPYGERWESTGGKGFSLSALQAIRVGFYRTRAYRVFEATVQAGRPYWPGAHFIEGDRVNVEMGNTGRLWTDHVSAIGCEWSRDSDVDYPVTIGDGQIEDTPGAMLSRQLASVKEIVQAVGVSS